MSEPTGSLLPTEYDHNDSLLGSLLNARNFTLAVAVDEDDTTIEVSGTLTDVNLPVYVTFDAGEMIYAEQVNEAKDAFVNVLRHVRGTPAQSHTIGDTLYLALTGKHAILARDCMIAAEKYQGLVGLFSARPASPHVSEVYVATDEDKVYFAIGDALEDGEWLYVGRKYHDELTGLSDDDHSQYHTNARALSWHGGLPGLHLEDGDSHTHLKGDGAGHVQSGNTPPTVTYVREVYYDEDDAILYISADGSTWKAILGAPQGAIGMFDEAIVHGYYGDACPPGWSRFTALDSKFPIGAPAGITSPLNNVGADTHTHTYTQILYHRHNVQSVACNSSNSVGTGNHNHSFPHGSQSGSSAAFWATRNDNPPTVPTSSDGYHTHPVTIAAHVTSGAKKPGGSDGVAEGTTGSSDIKPPYRTVVFCQKN